jgi:signal transduction histidine kinase
MAQRARILVVDDSAVNQALVDEILGERYELAFADTGHAAIDAASAFRPDVVLLDIVMPGIDGYETCRRLRSDLDLCYAKIILVSGRTEVTDRLEGYQAGADDYLTKPFEPEELVAKVKVFLRLKSVEELDQLRMSILSLINHETRTPLNAIQGSFELLRMRDALDAKEIDEIVEISLANCRRLAHLIERSMLLNEFNSGAINLHLQEIDVLSVVNAAIAEVRNEADQRSVAIRGDVAPELHVDADYTYLVMLLTSLLDNAVRFSDEGGTVVVNGACDGDALTLEVTDTGRGIEASYLPYVFEAYVPDDIRHHTCGQGMSLAIGREIVKGHGGELSVTSTPGERTTFFVKLPIRAGRSDSVGEIVRETCPV